MTASVAGGAAKGTAGVGLSFNKVLGASKIIGSGLDLFGTTKQGGDDARALDFDSAFESDRAASILEAASIDVARARRFKRRLVSEQRAGFAKRGVKLSGSAFEALAENAAELELDALIIDHNARVEALAAESKSRQLARLASSKRTQTLFAGARSLLSSLPAVFEGLEAFKNKSSKLTFSAGKGVKNLGPIAKSTTGSRSKANTIKARTFGGQNFSLSAPKGKRGLSRANFGPSGLLTFGVT